MHNEKIERATSQLVLSANSDKEEHRVKKCSRSLTLQAEDRTVQILIMQKELKALIGRHNMDYDYTNTGRLLWNDVGKFYFTNMDKSCTNIGLDELLFVLSIPEEFGRVKHVHQKIQVLAHSTILSSFNVADVGYTCGTLEKAISRTEDTAPEDATQAALACLRAIGEFLTAGIPIVRCFRPEKPTKASSALCLAKSSSLLSIHYFEEVKAKQAQRAPFWKK